MLQLSEPWGSFGLPKWVRGLDFGSVQAAAVSGLADANHMLVSALDAGNCNPPTRCVWVRRRSEALCWNSHRFACWGGRLPCHGTGVPALPRRWARGNDGTACQESSCSTDRLWVWLKKDFLSWVRVDGPQTQAAEDTGRHLSTVRCLVLALGGGLVGFSYFQSFQALVQCSALVFCVFCLVLFSSFFSPLEDKHHLPHSGAVFWTSCTDH